MKKQQFINIQDICYLETYQDINEKGEKFFVLDIQFSTIKKQFYFDYEFQLIAKIQEIFVQNKFMVELSI